MEYCANCGRQLPENAQFCFACDTRVNKAMEQPESPDAEIPGQGEASPDEAEAAPAQAKRCGNCGALLADDADYCFACDTRLAQPSKPAEASTATPATRETSESGGRAAEPLQMGRCPSCGSPISAQDTFCATCGARVTGPHAATDRPKATSRKLPLWAQAALAAGLVVAAILVIWQATQPPESITPAPLSPTATQSQATASAVPNLGITLSPQRLSLVGMVGESVPSQEISILCSATGEDLRWRATSDVTWLSCLPTNDSLDTGSSDFLVRISARNLDEGSYTGAVSIRVDGFEGVLATLEVTLEMQPFEDPDAEAARNFWESSVYRGYWQSGAQTDVREAVRAYAFPEYGHGIADAVYFRSVDIEYSPDLYPRPIARVHCEAQFVVMEDLDQTIRTRMTYYTDTMVILQVAPGPFSTSDNEWQVVDVYDYPN